MAISTAQLEQMTERLQALKSHLARREQSPDAPMDRNDPAVEMAGACEFPLPGKLTGRTLAEDVDRKIANVDVLMARAREHEALSPEMRAAADQENTLMVEDYKGGGIAYDIDDSDDAEGAEHQKP